MPERLKAILDKITAWWKIIRLIYYYKTKR